MIWTVKALEEILQAIPIPVKAIHSNNGSEFINAHMERFCRQRGIRFTRLRPYRKKDAPCLFMPQMPLLSRQRIDGKVTKNYEMDIPLRRVLNLDDRYLYLFLDAVVLKEKTGIGTKKRYVLVAYGIRIDGKREIIDFRVVSAESQNKWIGFLQDLYNRGLKGEVLSLIITDGNAGLENAVDFVYPLVKRQRCWAQKLRNVANYLRKKDIKRCINEARGFTMPLQSRRP